MDRSLEIERLDELGEVVSIGVQIVAVPGLTRATMATPVMGNAAVATGGQKKHLVFPGVRAQGPAVTEDHGWSAAPVLVIDLCAVMCGDRGHRMVSLRVGYPRWASTNQRYLSTPREFSVQISAVSLSPHSSACSMARRTLVPYVARADESASTCSRSSASVSGYSFSPVRAVATWIVPSAVPPHWTTRSASKSI